jgi:hypothetical protein
VTSKINPLSAQTITTSVSVEMPMTYLHFNAGQGKPLLLLFHGYEDTAAGVVRRTLGDPKLFSEFEILAPNGLFFLSRSASRVGLSKRMRGTLRTSLGNKF